MALSKKRHPKMDSKLIAANQPHEIRHVRAIAIKWVDDEPFHPSREEVIALAKKHNNSRGDVYADLEQSGYEIIVNH